MFGYVRPYRSELKLKDYDRFQSIYCGLCHTISARCGQIPRLFLNYDFTFLAILLSAMDAETACSDRRCLASPFRKKCCAARTESLSLTADLSVILTYWKLRDNMEDEGFFRALPSCALAVLMYPAYRRAKRARPEFDASVRGCLNDLRLLADRRSASLDEAADTFARILSAAANSLSDPALSRPMEQLLYHTGRWIYLADAYHDRKDDMKKKRYNPLFTRFSSGHELCPEEKAELETTMTHSLNLAYAACALIEFGPWTELVRNILYLGMPAAQKLVLADLWTPEKGRKLLASQTSLTGEHA